VKYNGDQGHEKELQHFIVKARSLDFKDIMVQRFHDLFWNFCVKMLDLKFHFTKKFLEKIRLNHALPWVHLMVNVFFLLGTNIAFKLCKNMILASRIIAILKNDLRLALAMFSMWPCRSPYTSFCCLWSSKKCCHPLLGTSKVIKIAQIHQEINKIRPLELKGVIVQILAHETR